MRKMFLSKVRQGIQSHTALSGKAGIWTIGKLQITRSHLKPGTEWDCAPWKRAERQSKEGKESRERWNEWKGWGSSIQRFWVDFILRDDPPFLKNIFCLFKDTFSPHNVASLKSGCILESMSTRQLPWHSGHCLDAHTHVSSSCLAHLCCEHYPYPTCAV